MVGATSTTYQRNDLWYPGVVVSTCVCPIGGRGLRLAAAVLADLCWARSKGYSCSGHMQPGVRLWKDEVVCWRAELQMRGGAGQGQAHHRSQGKGGRTTQAH